MARYVYVTISEEDRIASYEADRDTGKLTKLGDTEASASPAPLAICQRRQYLYAGLRGNNRLASYRIDSASGGLTPVSSVDLPSDPCYLATDQSGRYLLGAYYDAGLVTVHRIEGERAEQVQCIETYRGAHSIQTDPMNLFAFVPHIAGADGPNLILQYHFDQDSGTLTPNAQPELSPKSSAGPRHFCIHPRLNVFYFSNEQDSSVTSYRLNVYTGSLEPFETVSTLPDGFEGENSCAQIQVSSTGRFLYAPNRGHNSIACFALDPDSGRMTRTAIVPTEPIPRAFSLDPDGRFLYASGLESGNLALYEVDEDAGGLTAVETYRVGEGPMWVLVADV